MLGLRRRHRPVGRHVVLRNRVARFAGGFGLWGTGAYIRPRDGLQLGLAGDALLGVARRRLGARGFGRPTPLRSQRIRRLHPSFQVIDRFVHDQPGDAPGLFDIAQQHGVVAKDVDRARNAARELEHLRQRRFGEQAVLLGARHVQPVTDIPVRVLPVERIQVERNRDALPKLLELAHGQLAPKRRLTHQDDLQELGRLGLGVGQHPDLFEHDGRQVLCLVDDQDHRTVLGELAHQKPVELEHQLLFGQPGVGQIQLVADGLQQALGAQVRVGDHGRNGLVAQLVQQHVAEHRLARPGLTGDQGEAFALVHGEAEAGQCLLVLGTGEEVPRVGRRREGLLCETVEALVHGGLPQLRRSIRA